MCLYFLSKALGNKIAFLLLEKLLSLRYKSRVCNGVQAKILQAAPITHHCAALNLNFLLNYLVKNLERYVTFISWIYVPYIPSEMYVTSICSIAYSKIKKEWNKKILTRWSSQYDTLDNLWYRYVDIKIASRYKRKLSLSNIFVKVSTHQSNGIRY